MPKHSFLEQACKDHVDTLGEVLSCVTQGRVAARPYAIDASDERQYALVPPDTMRLRPELHGSLRVGFRQVTRAVRHGAGAEDEWSIAVVAYEYRLLDHHARELLVYHWHPEAAGPDFPHLHVSASLDAQIDALNRRQIPLDKRHVVTGWVELRDFVRMLITEFEVRPLRADWEQRLGAASR